MLNMLTMFLPISYSRIRCKTPPGLLARTRPGRLEDRECLLQLYLPISKSRPNLLGP
jgi:hypothetical protein